MNYLKPDKFVDHREYDYIVSIGNKCPTRMILSKLNIYKESFPFDSIPTTPFLILKYLQNQEDFYPEKNVVRTKDNVWFGHFDINNNYNDLCRIVEYIIETYNYDNFKLLCVHTNKSFIDSNNVVNYRINVPSHYLSDDMSTHTQQTTLEYRSTLENLMREIFNV